MKEQIKLYPILEHDTEPTRVLGKTRKKISQKERIKCGNFIAEKAKEQVNMIIKSLNSVSKQDKVLEKFRFKGGKENEYRRKID
ncbi:hypothetical protein D4R42_01660 [bacterium]|nr:MAG: hypothetical protein D4R42_01660 [bacterium]